jgi:ribosomal protein L37AE/L43A
MSEPDVSEPATRPTACPFCRGKAVDTFAKVITVTTFWRCRTCDKTWTIASQAPASRRGAWTS